MKQLKMIEKEFNTVLTPKVAELVYKWFHRNWTSGETTDSLFSTELNKYLIEDVNAVNVFKRIVGEMLQQRLG
jgi:hypothetical protein